MTGSSHIPQSLTQLPDGSLKTGLSESLGASPHAAPHCAITVAALFVARDGCYFNLTGVEPWDQARDARTYAGPWPVVAHPPCERWGRYWGGAPKTWPRKIKGDDGGCFAAALAAVRRWGGILEHPEASAAWDTFGLAKPPRGGGWIQADWLDGHEGWTCCVEQGAYGHRARKATWLYAHGVTLPSLKWGAAEGDFVRLDDGFHSAEERARAVKTGAWQRLSKKQRAATPVEFRDLLISIARTATRRAPATDLQRSGLNRHVPGAHCPEAATNGPRGLSLDAALHAPTNPTGA